MSVRCNSVATVEVPTTVETREATTRLFDDHRHRREVVCLGRIIDDRIGVPAGDHRIAVRVTPGAENDAPRVEIADRIRLPVLEPRGHQIRAVEIRPVGDSGGLVVSPASTALFC